MRKWPWLLVGAVTVVIVLARLSARSRELHSERGDVPIRPERARSAEELVDASAAPPGALSGSREPLIQEPASARRDGRRNGHRRRARDATLIIRALAADSALPLADVDVHVGFGRLRPTMIRTTDETGSVEYPVASRVRLHVHAEGRHPFIGRSRATFAPLAPAERRVVEIRLPTGNMRYFGRVLDRASGDPVENALVALRDSEGAGNEEGADLAQSRTDSSGRFEWLVDEEKRLKLRIEAEGFAPAWGEVVRGHDSPAHAQVFRLWRPATITGRVVDAHGDPRAGVTLWAGCEVQHLLAIPEPGDDGLVDPGTDPGAWGFTDETGAFRIENLPPRALVELVIPGRERWLPTWSQSLTLGPGEEREVEIVLHEDVRLSGWVVDQHGQPVPGLVLWMKSARELPAEDVYFNAGRGPDLRCTSASDGSFRFDLVPPGPWHVGPTGQVGEQRVAPRATCVVLQPEPAEQELVLRVDRGLFIRGRVALPEGQPCMLGFIELQSALHWVPNGIFHKDGSFAVGPLANGLYSLAATCGGLRSDPVEVRAPGEGVVLNLPSAPVAGIRARIEGEPAGFAGAEARLIDRSRPFEARAADSFVGVELEFDGLQPGLYDLIVTTAGGRSGAFASARASTEGERVPMFLEECAPIRVIPAGEAGYVNVRAVRSGGTVALAPFVRCGTSALLRVPPGDLVVEAVAVDPWTGEPTGELRSREVRAVLGEEIEVELP